MWAKELKIDDWVLTPDDEPMVLTDIGRQTMRGIVRKGEIELTRTEFVGGLKGLPLTKEILEKNGWTYYGTERYWEYQCKYEFTLVHRKGKGFEIEQVPYITFQYVHELQHILWAINENDRMKI